MAWHRPNEPVVKQTSLNIPAGQTLGQVINMKQILQLMLIRKFIFTSENICSVTTLEKKITF